MRLKRGTAVNTLVLGLYNVELYPLDLKILLRDDAGPWQAIAYERANDRRHFAYYFPTTRIREIRLEATNFHGQNRLILSEVALGSRPMPKRIPPTYGSFLASASTLRLEPNTRLLSSIDMPLIWRSWKAVSGSQVLSIR